MLGPQAFGPIRFFMQVELACVIKSTKGVVSLKVATLAISSFGHDNRQSHH